MHAVSEQQPKTFHVPNKPDTLKRDSKIRRLTPLSCLSVFLIGSYSLVPLSLAFLGVKDRAEICQQEPLKACLMQTKS